MKTYTKGSAAWHRQKTTQKHQANPNAGGKTFSPRGLYRGLTVPWSNKPGRKYLHPENHPS